MDTSFYSYAFWFFGFCCVYSYFLYPLLLKLMPARKTGCFDDMTDALQQRTQWPRMSLIITVHNEAARIGEKLENTLQIDYPHEQLEVIVASDFSTDETEAIVQSYADKGIKLVRADERKGKEYAQLCGIQASTGGILVFSDVATMIPENALKYLAAGFDEPQVGAISSEDQFLSQDGKVVGEGAYVKYEMWLRRQESSHAGLVGLSGSFFAARRVVCEEWDIYCPSDFNTALNTAKQGLVAITCPQVLGIYKDVKDASLEYRRKMRTVIRGMTAIARHPEVLNPFRMGFFAIQVWSHKIVRWGVPWFMLIFAVLTLRLQGEGLIYSLAFWAQAGFYGIALAGWLSHYLRENTLVKLIFFFVQTNMALAVAALQFITGKRMTVWTPSQR